jgi:predicted permease
MGRDIPSTAQSSSPPPPESLQSGQIGIVEEPADWHATGLLNLGTMIRLLRDLLADLRFAARLLRRTPGFSLVAVSSLALGIGAATSIFTVIDAVVVKALPVRSPSELYIAQVHALGGSSTRFSYPLFERARDALNGRADLSASSNVARMLVTDASGAVPRPDDVARVQLVSGEYFAMLGTRPQLGRLLTPADNRSLGAHPVAVVSDGFWTRRFGRRADIVNRQISVNGASFTIVGISAPGFFGTVADSRPDVWVPVMMQSTVKYANNANVEDGDIRQPWVPQPEVAWLTVIARVADGRHRPAVEAGLTRLLQQQLAQRESYRTESDARRRMQAQRVALEPGSRGLSRLRQQTGGPLVALFAMVALLLVIACANLAGLLLARAAARGRELAVRVSIGAGRGRIQRQLLAESLLIGAAGGVCGLVVARWSCDALLALVAGTSTTLAVDLPLDHRVLVFATAVSMLTAVGFGILPALRASRVDPAEMLNAYGRGIVAPDRSRLPLGRLLVVGQLALTVLLLSVAALFARTLQHLVRVNVGYDDQGIVVARIDPRTAGYSAERLPVLHRAIVERLEATPGIRSASLSLHGPLSGGARTSSLAVEGYQMPPGPQPTVQEDIVTERYFETMGVTLVRGRLFSPADPPGGHASVINETMARRFFANRDPIGRRWAYDEPATGPDAFEIIGVVSDAHYNDLRGEIPSATYRLASQTDEYLTSVEVRSSRPLDATIRDLRAALASIDPRLPVLEVTSMTTRVRALTAQERSVALLAAAFGVAALFLACLGLYGTMAYRVTRRTPEIGVRIALGADRRTVLWLVMRDALLMIVAGMAVGVPLALLAAQQLTQFLYEIAAGDLVSYTGAVIVLLVIATAAAWLPARRAAAVDPMAALRAE